MTPEVSRFAPNSEGVRGEVSVIQSSEKDLLHPNTIARPVRKVLNQVPVVVLELLGVFQPALRNERIWMTELGRVVISAILPNAHKGLCAI